MAAITNPAENIHYFPGTQPTAQQNMQIPLSLAIRPVSPSGAFDLKKTNFNSNGRKKAESADPLRSYSDYRKLSDHFLSTGKIRDYALLTIGIATGLRVSDLLALKIGHLLTSDGSGKPVFRDFIQMKEKKTGKRTYNSEDAVLITEAVRYAATLLINSYTAKKGRKKVVAVMTLDDWLFKSKKPRLNEYEVDENGNQIKNFLYGEYVLGTDSAHRILKKAQRDCGIPINMGTHTMRKTFTCLAYVIAREMSGGSLAALELVQILTRHANARVTMGYVGITKAQTDLIRNRVSDFLMGKSEIEEISLV